MEPYRTFRSYCGDPLRVGGRYFVAGQGPMEIVELPDESKEAKGKTTVTLQTPEGGRYWAFPAQICTPITRTALERYIADLEVRIKDVDIDAYKAWLA